MMHILTKKEEKEHLKRLLKFCKENQTLMWNYMLTIERIRSEPEDKILMEKIKKQAEEYKKQASQSKRRKK